jgi:hypothetical protein
VSVLERLDLLLAALAPPNVAPYLTELPATIIEAAADLPADWLGLGYFPSVAGDNRIRRRRHKTLRSKPLPTLSHVPILSSIDWTGLHLAWGSFALVEVRGADVVYDCSVTAKCVTAK